MPNLFNHNLIKTHIQKHQIDSYDEKIKVIEGWKKSLQTVKGVNEKALQSAFLQGIFGKVLSYKCFGEADEWNLNIEVSTEVDATTPDGILGYYTAEDSNTQVVIELKSPKHSLDKKQQRAGKDYGTPVEQAFSYVSKYDRCSWVIVSNMNEIRLYKLGRSQEYYESFFIDDLDQEDNFKKFHLLLCKENLIQKDGYSETYKLSERTKERIQDISVSFYNLYKDIRIRLFEELKKSNPDYSQESLVEKAQKFLDRIIFICFCEDLGLLPNDLLHQAIQRGKNSFSDSEYVIWEEIKGVFRAIEKGSEKHNIPAYDGGLFAFDEVLDNLSIRNDFFDTVYDISAYDFGTDLDVNILGHIFEQSIADIEELKSDVQKEEYDPQKSRRKKEGIYYTPNYITKYIVENSLGKYLEDIRKELGEDDLPDIESATNVQTEGRYRKRIQKFYQDYEERVKQVKVLDPACGSGAFLNQAFDFLLEEYRWIHDKISELFEGQTTIFDSDTYQRSVLQDNLYGVDLNEESVEITKLSLWLKTADSRKALPYLDDNIKCGNSLIDDPEIAGDKAFDWNKEFSEIMEGGGFDVVIGNPPYVDSENMSKNLKHERVYLSDNYYSTRGNWDLFIPFIEKSFNLLREKGVTSLITPNKWLSMSYGTAIRKIIKKHLYLISDHSNYRVFEDAGIFPIVFFASKKMEADLEIRIFSKDKVVSKAEIDKNSELFMQFDNLGIYFSDNINILNKLIEGNELFEKLNIDISGAFTTSEAYEVKPLLENKEAHDDNYLKFVNTGTIDRYVSLWGIQPTRYLKEDYIYPVILRDNIKTYFPRRFERFNRPKIIISGIRHFECIYDKNNEYIAGKSTIVLLNNSKYISYDTLIGILNSNLIKFYLIESFSSSGMDGGINYSPAVIKKIPFPSIDEFNQDKLSTKTNLLTKEKYRLLDLNNYPITNLINKYVSSNMGAQLDEVINKGGYYNEVYTGRAGKFNSLFVWINDYILTIFTNKSGSGKVELMKFEVKDHYKRQYLKLFLENLTEEQLAEVNQYEGNILNKVIQIKIPDYDKPHVIKRVVDEWNQLQKEKAELEEKIGRTDKEIDQMVYELYGLTDEEIIIVEENV